MSVVLRRCGEDAVLVELDDGRQRRRWEAGARAAGLPGLAELVPGVRTVLLRASDPSALRPLVDAARRVEPTDPPAPDAGAELIVPVRYDGPDLAEVAALLDLAPDELVRRHTGQSWEVDVCGFAPGFGYLVPAPGADAGTPAWPGDPVPRRATPRTRVPAGSVALAGPWSAVYPSASAGGWQLVGSTGLAVWDPDREPPALLVPGRRVRFEAVR